MTATLVPVALDVLVVRNETSAEDWALTAAPAPKAQVRGRRQVKLFADPFQPLAAPRAKGAYLHWALPDALTQGRSVQGKPWFPPLPDRWLVLRLSGSARTSPRVVDAWLIPDAGARTANHVAHALQGPELPPVQSAPVAPLTVLGHGDVGWAAYYDNVVDRFALYDDLAGVTGPIAYLVCGWYTDAKCDPLNATNESDFHDRMGRMGWELQKPLASGVPYPKRSLYHAAALSIGWPQASWPGDGGSLGSEPDLRPDPDNIEVAIGETLAEAIAAIATPMGTRSAAVSRLIEGTLAGVLGDIGTADGPATLDTALHVGRFGSTPSQSKVEYIWQPAAQNSKAAGHDGAFRPVKRTMPRVWHAIDPALCVRGAGRTPRHGGDGRYTTNGYLLCRVEGETVTGFGVRNGNAGHGAEALPASPLAGLPTGYGIPPVVGALLVELASLDPGSAPDLAQSRANAPSPVAAARARWWSAFDPGTPASQALAGATVAGVLPCPVGVCTPMRPWNPIHIEWSASYLPSPRGAHDWTLSEVDFAPPTTPTRPDSDPDHHLQGRTMLGTGAAALLHSAAGDGSGVADEDILGGTLADIAAQLRGDSTAAVVHPKGTTLPKPSLTRPLSFLALRAGFLKIDRLRLVDGFGQFIDLIGGSRATPIPVRIGDTLAVGAQPDLVALRPRFTAPARCLLRFTDGSGAHVEAGPGVSPVCGYMVPSTLDGSLEFFDANGNGYGRLRPDPISGAAWEDDPGHASTLGALPSAALPNPFLGKIADSLVSADTAAISGGAAPGALRALVSLLDITGWSVDPTGRAGDEYLSLLIGHPIAVVRAVLKLEVQDPRQPPENKCTAVPVKLGTLAHLQDGLLAYYVGDAFDQVHQIDPALGALAAAAGLSSIESPYIYPDGSFYINAGVEVPLTLLMVPGSDVHVTTGLLPQKKLGLLREWTATALTRLSPALRFGPVLRDSEATRLPVSPDIRGNWLWHRHRDPATWATDEVVSATTSAILPDVRVEASDGWLQVKLLPDTTYLPTGIQVEITHVASRHVTKEGRQILGIGGINPDGTPFLLSVAQAVELQESGRFAFYVDRLKESRVYTKIVKMKNGTRYLRTTMDKRSPNNLGLLPECPRDWRR